MDLTNTKLLLENIGISSVLQCLLYFTIFQYKNRGVWTNWNVQTSVHSLYYSPKMYLQGLGQVRKQIDFCRVRLGWVFCQWGSEVKAIVGGAGG